MKCQAFGRSGRDVARECPATRRAARCGMRDSHLIHGVFFAIGEMLGMNKITDFFIALGGVLLVVGAMLLVVFVMTFVI